MDIIGASGASDPGSNPGWSAHHHGQHPKIQVHWFSTSESLEKRDMCGSVVDLDSDRRSNVPTLASKVRVMYLENYDLGWG